MKSITAQEARALIKAHGGIYLSFHWRGRRRMMRVRNKGEALRWLKGVPAKAVVAVERDSYDRIIIHADAPPHGL